MITFFMLQAKYVIAKSWELIVKPSISAWLAGMLQTLSVEKLSFKFKSKFSILRSCGDY